jgi:quinol-cytochrome oxidoreductase complex cytochrome b subunit
MAKQELIFEGHKYDPPYPQSFYPFWPKHVIRAGSLVLLIFVGLLALSYYFRMPTDINMPPLPDEGMGIPAPDWYLLFLFQPFWYLIEENQKWQSIGTFWLPFLAIAFLLLVPVIFRKRDKPAAAKGRMKTSTKLVTIGILVVVWFTFMGGVVKSGYPAKTQGCMSCHNPMMGVRQALPPANIGEYYRNERQRQVNLGGYNIGGQGGPSSYKDANWQLRHFYEPTMTW